MTITYVKGDMVVHLASKEHLDAYAHQCNCFCRMGRGIAPLLARVVPGLRDADNSTPLGDKKKLGTFSQAVHPNGAAVFNLYGQFHWQQFKVALGRNTDYKALETALKSMREHLLKASWSLGREVTLGMPLIGCGLAGGDWHGVVAPMIESIFENTPIKVTIFVL